MLRIVDDAIPFRHPRLESDTNLVGQAFIFRRELAKLVTEQRIRRWLERVQIEQRSFVGVVRFLLLGRFFHKLVSVGLDAASHSGVADHPAHADCAAALEGRRPGPIILRGSP